MSKWILSAAILSAMTFLLHVFGGGPQVNQPVLESEFPAGLKAVLSVVWHIVSAVLLINSVALFFAARSAAHRFGLIALVSAQYLAFAGVFVYYGLAHLGTLLLMPQWIIFLCLTGLSLAGLRPGTPSDRIGIVEETR